MKVNFIWNLHHTPAFITTAPEKFCEPSPSPTPFISAVQMQKSGTLDHVKCLCYSLKDFAPERQWEDYSLTVKLKHCDCISCYTAPAAPRLLGSVTTFELLCLTRNPRRKMNELNKDLFSHREEKVGLMNHFLTRLTLHSFLSQASTRQHSE